jgi:mono/diheme cytochrome c family protein
MTSAPTVRRAALATIVLAMGVSLGRPVTAAAEDVRDLYLRHCGACHGPEARGDGIAAPYITPRPPDLTTIAARNGGRFPTGAVAAKIDGRQTLPIHGTREMPIWGRRFAEAAADPAGAPGAARGRVLELTEYLRSLQRE